MGIFSLWQAILASAVGVWLLSALVWMVFPWHKSDFSRTGDEEAVRAALNVIPCLIDARCLGGWADKHT